MYAQLSKHLENFLRCCNAMVSLDGKSVYKFLKSFFELRYSSGEAKRDFSPRLIDRALTRVFGFDLLVYYWRSHDCLGQKIHDYPGQGSRRSRYVYLGFWAQRREAIVNTFFQPIIENTASLFPSTCSFNYHSLEQSSPGTMENICQYVKVVRKGRKSCCEQSNSIASLNIINHQPHLLIISLPLLSQPTPSQTIPQNVIRN